MKTWAQQGMLQVPEKQPSNKCWFSLYASVDMCFAASEDDWDPQASPTSRWSSAEADIRHALTLSEWEHVVVV